MLTRLEITSREPVLKNKTFGKTGPYEILTGSAYFCVDPANPLNQPIVDLNLAPVNVNGLVECRADIHILKPAESNRGNGGLFYHVVNRGRKGLLAKFNLAEASNRPHTEAHFGDGFLMNEGYTVACCGWQVDVPPEAPDNPDLMTLDVPIATQNKNPILGIVRSEIVVDAPTHTHSLGSRYHHAYEVANSDDPTATLTVRNYPMDPPEPIPRDQWAFATVQKGKQIPSPRHVTLSTGFEPGRIYDVVYTAKNPTITGLGFAATRDFVSFCKYETADAQNTPNPLAGTIQRAHAFGSSQSGRFLRHLLYLGFNQDEQHRNVFDGILAHVAGGARGSFNHRFAQPSRHTCSHIENFYPTEQFPFTDLEQTDPHTEEKGALLERCEQTHTTPKIFYTNTSTEYWNRSASLVHTDLEGKTDVSLHPNVRLYHFSGTQHGPGAFPPPHRNPHPVNPVNFSYGMRALFSALDAWVLNGTEPPSNQYSTIAQKTLVPATAETVGFPTVVGLSFPRAPRQPYRLDFGPKWEQGIITIEPPLVGPPYPVRVPATDSDGNEISGIRMPEVAVPLGTFTGWRFRRPESGAPNALVGLEGAWVPFARTATDRQAAGDPRLSVQERYENREAYLDQVRRATQGLIDDRYVLPCDLNRILERAKAMYDWVLKA
ncbi:MAG: alpha/beta hydrolase domain-containing protein [bacterium]|nr:alpha/beta hydrolase domain-containing protein [bacterium]